MKYRVMIKIVPENKRSTQTIYTNKIVYLLNAEGKTIEKIN